MLIPDPSVLGTVVRKRRNELGMSQTDLAKAVGTTRQWLSRFEQSSNDVSVSIIFAILKELELELEISEVGAAEQGSEIQAPVIPSPEAANSEVPGHAVPPVPEPPQATAEPRPDRFALLRSRDALSGLRPPRPAQQVAATQPELPPHSSTAQPPFLDKKKRADASVRMDQDIARIKKSSLFKR